MSRNTVGYLAVDQFGINKERQFCIGLRSRNLEHHDRISILYSSNIFYFYLLKHRLCKKIKV
ncbi:hypothetical protein BpHYR1_041011 [Brachionus plicatilis]|uniref:Uncharacterized protein n=1 Tax=Brachionus plicatilis TaxID=10195 RepID=A0A3M7QWS1_BRAPC|nr:hypothetical protein BpHYR1_041011 [Brachionus plicatilis]